MKMAILTTKKLNTRLGFGGTSGSALRGIKKLGGSSTRMGKRTQAATPTGRLLKGKAAKKELERQKLIEEYDRQLKEYQEALSKKYVQPPALYSEEFDPQSFWNPETGEFTGSGSYDVTYYDPETKTKVKSIIAKPSQYVRSLYRRTGQQYMGTYIPEEYYFDPTGAIKTRTRRGLYRTTEPSDTIRQMAPYDRSTTTWHQEGMISGKYTRWDEDQNIRTDYRGYSKEGYLSDARLAPTYTKKQLQKVLDWAASKPDTPSGQELVRKTLAQGGISYAAAQRYKQSKERYEREQQETQAKKQAVWDRYERVQDNLRQQGLVPPKSKDTKLTTKSKSVKLLPRSFGGFSTNPLRSLTATKKPYKPKRGWL